MEVTLEGVPHGATGDRFGWRAGILAPGRKPCVCWGCVRVCVCGVVSQGRTGCDSLAISAGWQVGSSGISGSRWEMLFWEGRAPNSVLSSLFWGASPRDSQERQGGPAPPPWAVACDPRV